MEDSIIVNSIANLDTSNVSRIVLVVLKYLVESATGSTTAFERLFNVLEPPKREKIYFLYTNSQSGDAVETVTMAIENACIRGPILIKDADNDFVHSVVEGNYVTYASIVRNEQASMHHTLRFLRPDLVDASAEKLRFIRLR